MRVVDRVETDGRRATRGLAVPVRPRIRASAPHTVEAEDPPRLGLRCHLLLNLLLVSDKLTDKSKKSGHCLAWVRTPSEVREIMLTSIRTPKVKQQLYALRYAQRYAQRNVTYSHPTAALLSRPQHATVLI